jgi:purine-binding chemotaxis protein CheW
LPSRAERKVDQEKSAKQEEEEKRRTLFFRSGGELFALDIAAVEEIALGLDFTPVPMAPQGVVGVVNHRGEIYTLVDFARLSGIGENGVGAVTVFLCRQEMSVGVVVQSIDGIEWVPCRLMENLAEEGTHAGFLSGVLDYGGKVANVVDAAGLAGNIARLADPSSEGSGLEE